MSIRNLTYVAGAIACGLAAAAHGEIRTFAMEGTVSAVYDPLSMLEWIDVGNDRMVYTFSFDSDAPDVNPNPFGADYSGLSASLHVGDTAIAVAAPLIRIGHPSDIFRLESHLVFAAYEGDAVLTLSDQAESNALTDVSLPIVPYDLAPWQFKHFGIGIYVPQPGYPDSVTIGFTGDIDSFYIVPEPTSVALLLTGLLLLIRRHSWSPSFYRAHVP